MHERFNLKPYLAKAQTELQERSIKDIQIETALIWAARACVAQRANKQVDAVEYAHESIEHAALSGDSMLLDYVRNCLRHCKVRGI
jgi:hypothetical protein